MYMNTNEHEVIEGGTGESKPGVGIETAHLIGARLHNSRVAMSLNTHSRVIEKDDEIY